VTQPAWLLSQKNLAFQSLISRAIQGNTKKQGKNQAETARLARVSIISRAYNAIFLIVDR